MKAAYSDEQLEGAVREVLQALDLKLMRKRLQQDKESLFAALGGQTFGPPHARHVFKSNKARILMVAHLDTVQADKTFGIVRYPHETLIFNPRHDDRLGAYTILDLMPALGVNADLLFTDNEERGLTTAADFKTDKKYNWIVSFDRRGEDVVTYQYTWDAVLREYFMVGHGSFSCIGKLDHLGCQAMNVGVGYCNEHSPRAFMVLEEYVRNMARFLLFYRRYKSVRFLYTRKTHYWDKGWSNKGKHKDNKTPDKVCVWCTDNPAMITSNLCRDCDRERERLERDYQASNGRTNAPAKPGSFEQVAQRDKTGTVSPIEKPKPKLEISKSKYAQLAEKPDAVAFCEICWAALERHQVLLMYDAAHCTECGTMLEIEQAK